jgi:hypothetical protein
MSWRYGSLRIPADNAAPARPRSFGDGLGRNSIAPVLRLILQAGDSSPKLALLYYQFAGHKKGSGRAPPHSTPWMPSKSSASLRNGPYRVRPEMLERPNTIRIDDKFGRGWYNVKLSDPTLGPHLKSNLQKDHLTTCRQSSHVLWLQWGLIFSALFQVVTYLPGYGAAISDNTAVDVQAAPMLCVPWGLARLF